MKSYSLAPADPGDKESAEPPGGNNSLRRLINIVAVVLLGAGIVVFGQESLQLRVDVQLVTVDFYVDDTTGGPVTNLTRDDFTVLEDGEPREIQSFESAENPYNILLLFDRSASTQNQWPFLVTAVSRFLEKLPDQHRAALAAFDVKPEMLLTWNSARELVRQPYTIRGGGSGTDVYGALEWAIRELAKVKGRKGLIVFTDGIDNRLSKKLVSFGKDGLPRVATPEEDSDFQKMLRILTQARTPVYFVAVNTDLNLDPKMPRNPFDLKQRAAARSRMDIVAQRSNGVLHLPMQIEDVVALYETIGQELGYSYTVGFTPAKTSRDGSYHRVEIQVRNRAMRVTPSRDGYYAR